MKPRQLTVVLTLSGRCPEGWDTSSSEEIKGRAEQVTEDMARQIFRNMGGLLVTATATVEEARP